jgi:ribosomal protein S18 acetylase RimI-like enzyme
MVYSIAMEEIIIRTATLNDIGTLLQFEQGVIAAERPFDSTLKDDPINYYDLGNLIKSSDAEVVVAETNKELIGSGYALIKDAQAFLKHKQYAYLGFMYVKPAFRGQGINKKIIEALKQWAVSKGLTEMRLEVYMGNTAAIKAYDKVGFTSHLLEMRMGLKE